MNRFLRAAIGSAILAIASHASADATMYEHHDYQGKALMTPDAIEDLGRWGFGGNVASMAIDGQAWQVCEGVNFSGRCAVLQPGNYASVREMGLAQKPRSVRPAAAEPPPPPPPPPPVPAFPEGLISFFEFDGFAGRTFNTAVNVPDFRRFGFNDVASSVVVRKERWVVCELPRFEGKCAILRPGLYPSLFALGFNDRISSARPLSPDAVIEPGRYMPDPTPWMNWQARPQEQLHDVPVSSIHAVYGTPQQRCWVEREQVVQRGDPGAGAVIGGLIGGILGHELSGRGNRDVGTVGGAAVGAIIGANASSGYVAGTQNVQRCSSVPSSHPAYWDVGYYFRGVEHHVQMTNPPANGLIRVNDAGEPRN
jgi:uncharacterized protein YcfJ